MEGGGEAVGRHRRMGKGGSEGGPGGRCRRRWWRPAAARRPPHTAPPTSRDLGATSVHPGGAGGGGLKVRLRVMHTMDTEAVGWCAWRIGAWEFFVGWFGPRGTFQIWLKLTGNFCSKHWILV